MSDCNSQNPQCRALMCKEGLRNKKDAVKWLLKHHPDKGGEPTSSDVGSISTCMGDKCFCTEDPVAEGRPVFNPLSGRQANTGYFSSFGRQPTPVQQPAPVQQPVPVQQPAPVQQQRRTNGFAPFGQAQQPPTVRDPYVTPFGRFVPGTTRAFTQDLPFGFSGQQQQQQQQQQTGFGFQPQQTQGLQPPMVRDPYLTPFGGFIPGMGRSVTSDLPFGFSGQQQQQQQQPRTNPSSFNMNWYGGAKNRSKTRKGRKGKKDSRKNRRTLTRK